MPDARANPLLVGHAVARGIFARAIGSGRLPHAWLLSGPRGVGKATFAWRVARWLLAAGALSGEVPAADDTFMLAPEHPVFRRVAAGGHPDLRAIERSRDDQGRLRSVITVDEVRAIAPFLSLTPAEGRYRIVIVDAAEDLNTPAANAVLKWLEEPPPNALVLMISHNPQRVLRTIRSRCCRLPLQALSAVETEQVLAGVAPTVGESAALARLAEGRPGRALALLADDGLALYGEMIAVLATLPALDWERVHRLADRLAGRQAEASHRLLVDLLADWIARATRAAAAGTGPDAVLGEESGLAERLVGGGANLARWTDVWEKITGLVARAELINLDRKQVVLAVFSGMRSALAA